MNNLITYFKQQIVLLICCFSFMVVSAQPSSISESSKISVLTCGVGNEMYSLFGHTALRIQDGSQNLDVVYNWGMFDFQTPNFYSKFVKGDLVYYLDVDSYDDFISSYTYVNRSVIEQELNLDYHQKKIIWEEINRQLKSKDRYYTYGFIRNNCTTKVVEVLNKVLTPKLDPKFPENNHSNRYILNEGLTDHYFEKLGINLLFGYSTNNIADLIFLPIKLQQGLSFYKGIISVEQDVNVVTDLTPNKWNSINTLWGIIILLSIFALLKKGFRIYFGVVAIFSLFLLVISLFTNHIELHFNVLILFFNPLTFIGLFINQKKVLFLGVILTILSLPFLGIELIKVILPLMFLHLLYILVLFLQFQKNK